MLGDAAEDSRVEGARGPRLKEATRVDLDVRWHSQAGVKHIVLAVNYRAEVLASFLAKIEEQYKITVSGLLPCLSAPLKLTCPPGNATDLLLCRERASRNW